MIILGINAYHGDAAAAIVRDGKLIAAAEEERFNRIKHCAGFPTEAIRYCLQAAGVGIEAVDHIGISRDPSAHLHKKILFAAGRAAKQVAGRNGRGEGEMGRWGEGERGRWGGGERGRGGDGEMRGSGDVGTLRWAEAETEGNGHGEMAVYEDSGAATEDPRVSASPRHPISPSPLHPVPP